MSEGELIPAFDQLPANLQKFVEAITAGMNGVEASKYCGCETTVRNDLARFSRSAKADPLVKQAIEDLREELSVDVEGLATISIQRLRDIIKAKTTPSNAAIRAIELSLKLTGLLAPQQHLHMHAGAGMSLADLTPEQSFTELVQHTRMQLYRMTPEERERFMREIAIPDVSQMLPVEAKVIDG